jgi:hypothetical protein
MPFEPFSSKGNQKDLVGIFSDFGKELKKIFKSSDKSSQNDALHDRFFSFGAVYANDLAKAEIEKESPNFPAGSIIVREKNAAATSETPEVVIAMVKREKGFSKKTNDWEFFVFSGADLKVNKRETKGDCASCHQRAEKTDWTFRDYLK